MNSRLQQFKKEVNRKLWKSMVATVLVFVLVMGITMFVCWLMLSQFIWYEGVFYTFLHFVNDNKGNILIFAGLLCAFVMLWRAYRKLLGYFNEVVEAAEIASRTDEQAVVLSPDLKEVEYCMNQIKANVKENAQAVKEAEQRKNDLIIYLAHDLKTPLTSVIGYLTLLRDERQISPELQEKYLAISLEKAERLEDLINEFFEITKFHLTNISLEYSTVNLTRMLEQITFEFMPVFAGKQLTCSLECEPDLMILCDTDKMQRVFGNLLRNAVNYSYERTDVHITVDADEHQVVMRFLNHGTTIPGEKLSRIFEQFYRLDSSRATRSGGAGLGLAIAKQIVQLHGGTICAESENETITFIVTLPLRNRME